MKELKSGVVLSKTDAKIISAVLRTVDRSAGAARMVNPYTIPQMDFTYEVTNSTIKTMMEYAYQYPVVCELMSVSSLLANGMLHMRRLNMAHQRIH